MTALHRPGAPASCQHRRATHSGSTVDLGDEYAFTGNLSAFIEYDWYSFGTEPNLFLTPAGFAVDYINIKDNKSVLKIGVNRKFGKGPVSHQLLRSRASDGCRSPAPCPRFLHLQTERNAEGSRRAPSRFNANER